MMIMSYVTLKNLNFSSFVSSEVMMSTCSAMYSIVISQIDLMCWQPCIHISSLQLLGKMVKVKVACG